MRVLLMMGEKHKKLNILVKLQEKEMQKVLMNMLYQNKSKEAFHLLKTKAEVEAFFPDGQRPSIPARFVLIEDEE